MKEKILKIEKGLSLSFKSLSASIYEHPELGFQEYHASKAHMELLKNHGFTIESNIVNLETAFMATYDSKKPGPKICYMAEYDALPQIGHGCGHNMLGTSSTGAAIVLRYLLDEFGGQVILLGTPAEETSGAKVTMARAGLFKQFDVALMAHPDTKYRLSTPSLALQPLAFEFFGKTSHAASAPFEGVNALDAMLITYTAINALRQEILPSARIHGVITHGGEAANIIPDYTRAEFYIRAESKNYLQQLTKRVLNCAKAGALASGCRLETSEYELPFDNMVSNESLNQVFYEAIQLFTDDEIITDQGAGVSLDAGNVSHELPCIHGYFPIADHDIPAHTLEFAQATQTPYAYQKLDEIICILAYCGYKVASDPNLLKAAKAEYDNQVKKGVIIPYQGGESI